MCIIEKTTYIHPDGSREIIETIHRCHRAAGPRLCAYAEHRNNDPVRLVEVRGEEQASSPKDVVVTQGRGERERFYRDVSRRASKRTSKRSSNNTTNEWPPVERPPSSSLNTVLPFQGLSALPKINTYQASRRDRSPEGRYARSRSPYLRPRSLERVRSSEYSPARGSLYSSPPRAHDSSLIVNVSPRSPSGRDTPEYNPEYDEYRPSRRREERSNRPVVVVRSRSPPIRDAFGADGEREQRERDQIRREMRDHRKEEDRKSRDKIVEPDRQRQDKKRDMEEYEMRAMQDAEIMKRKEAETRERVRREFERFEKDRSEKADRQVLDPASQWVEKERKERELLLEKLRKETELRDSLRMKQDAEERERYRFEMKKNEEAQKRTEPTSLDKTWTEITKDLVSKEALVAKGYPYSEDKSHFNVHKYLPEDDISELADLTAQIKASQLLHQERSSNVKKQTPSSQKRARPHIVEVKPDAAEGVSLSVASSAARFEENHDLALETALWEDAESRKSKFQEHRTVEPRDKLKGAQRPSERNEPRGRDNITSREKTSLPVEHKARPSSSSNQDILDPPRPVPTPSRETQIETPKYGHPEVSRSDTATYDVGKTLKNTISISPISNKTQERSVEILWNQKDEKLPLIDDFDDIDALIDPASYYAELDQLEIDVAEKCHLKSIFPQALPGSQHIEKGAGLYSNSQEMTVASGDLVRDHCRTVLYGILAALDLMRLRGFCGESIKILVKDAERSSVTRVVDIPIAQVSELRQVIELEANNTMALTNELTTEMLALFGARPHSRTYSEKDDSSVGEIVSLLCSLLALATVSYAGSHCHDIGQIVWSSLLDSITFDNAYTWSGKHLQFYKRSLACLKDFVGGPVWVFGSRDSTESLLSTTINQISDLWGPLIAVPSNESFKDLLMIQTEAGVLFQTKDSTLARIQAKDEVLIHWISCEPPRKARKLLDRIKISSKKGEKLPSKLIPFSANARLLIGHPPPPSGASCTVTSNNPGLSLNTQGGIRVNNFCQFDINRFQEDNEANLHLIGTWDESYVPDQLQLALTAGQYVNVGIQKVWKHRPACTQKARLLLALSNPRIRPSNLDKILQLSIGYEQSACTGNAKRVTLKQSLLWAYPSVAPLIEQACTDHDASYLLEFMVELSFTGMDAKGHLSLFWPFNDGQDALELTDAKPAWKDFLRDTRDSSCFAFISPRCLTYTGSDELRSRRIRMLCSCRPGNSARPVFQTAIELDPKAKVRLPLGQEARIRLADGFLEIRNSDATQLAVYGRRGLLSRLEELAICARDGQKGHQHRESMTAGTRPSRNTVPLCIVDR